MEFLPSPLGKSVPAGDDWFHELKSGGDRVRIERDGCRVRPITAPTGPIAAADRKDWVKVKNRKHPAYGRMQDPY